MSKRATLIWLLGLALGIFGMVIVGGYTRLTHSGLALVDWKPIVGLIPPLSQESWQSEWARYQQFPEFQKGVVTDFVLFQKLFWIEYGHRLLGRLVGFWLLIGVMWGWTKGCWPTWLSRRAGFWCVGIALQGWMGWYMVKSGLIKDPQVSPYRLTAHLWIALVLLTSVVSALNRLLKSPPNKGWEGSSCVYLTQAMVGITLTWGGFVAGHKAGLIYNTFPLMEGCWMPSDAWFYQPWWLNLWSNPACVQACHRYMALLTVGLITFCAFRLRKRWVVVWCGLAYAQASLGIITLLTQVPVGWALAHQAGGVVLWLWGWVAIVRRSERVKCF